MFGMSKPAAARKEAAKPKAAQAAGGNEATGAEHEGLVPVTLSLTPAQRDKLTLLGGEAWLRAAIDKARPGRK